MTDDNKTWKPSSKSLARALQSPPEHGVEIAVLRAEFERLRAALTTIAAISYERNSSDIAREALRLSGNKELVQK